jgi:hypothetical protein
VATIEEKRKVVQRSLKTRRDRLVAQGLCRDCGLNPIELSKKDPEPGRGPTLCKGCKADRRDREAKRRAKKAAGVA